MRNTAGQIGLALLLAANSVAVFSHGLFGLGSVFTASYMVLVTAALILLGNWRAVRFGTADYLALAFFALCAFSILLHPPANYKELVLLLLSFAAYPAARGLAAPVGKPFVITLATIVFAGVVATYSSFGTTETIDHGKPMVFGEFGHAPAGFTMLLGTVLVAVICSRMNIILAVLLAAVPAAVFAAAQVRFALIAFVAVLLGGIALPTSSRARFAVAGLVIILAIGTGAIAQKDTTRLYAQYAANTAANTFGTPDLKLASAANMPLPEPAANCPNVNLKNSLDIRKKLYAEAASMLPFAGPLGIGLDGFLSHTCVNAEVHNTFLQTAIEFGIPAALIFASLFVVIWHSLLKASRKSSEALFALCALSFAVMLSLIYGRLSQDGLLFATLGYGAAIASTGSRTPLTAS
jgi:hypothetical protein